MKSIQKLIPEVVTALLLSLAIYAICASAWSYGPIYAKISQNRPMLFSQGK